MRLLAFTVALLACVAPLHAQATQPADRRVLIISVDGLRPDLVLRPKMPNVRSLMESGSYTMWARTVPEAKTLPSHTSMLTGVTPQKHRVDWNDFQVGRYVDVPTIFEVARKHGFTTAMATGKMKFSTLAKPDTVDWCFIGDESKDRDPEVARAAVAFIAEHKPQVMFVHLADVDSAGHLKGWGTPEQIAAIEAVDGCIGQMVDALKAADLFGHTLIIISADHGGSGRNHWPEDARSRHIPWIAHGPGVRKNLDLTRYEKLNIDTEDTYATACAQLGIAIGPEIDGEPVYQIREEAELLQPATQAVAPAQE